MICGRRVLRVIRLLCGWIFLSGSWCLADDSRQAEFFEARIRPVLVEHCYECHSAEAKSLRGGLRLDTRETSRNGGDSGPAVVPGDPDASLLLSALRFETFEMPPEGKLPQGVIDDFQTWIESGAFDPRDGAGEGQSGIEGDGVDIAARREFWSFRPVTRPTIPEPQRAEWCENDIDRFLLAAMEAAALEPTADADRRTLLRRAYFDLIGLPPSPEQIAAFLGDASPTPEAFARVVDELLASPHFGERWGRHWLDVARYSESTGGGRSMLYRSSWRYRDYVINAFNRDKPFDQFIVEQIAGDLLPYDDVQQRADQLIATAFLALGPTNYEEQDKEQLRMDVIDEQIDTVGRAFLGMTLGCARCHDHKFDPVPTADYYALAGIFRSTLTLIDANVSNWVTRPLPVDDEWQRQQDEHQLAVEELQRHLDQQTAELAALKKRLPHVTLDDTDAKVLSGVWSESSSVKNFVGASYRYASGPGSLMEYRLPLQAPGKYEVRVSYSPHSNRSPNAPFVVKHRGGESTVTVDQRQPPKVDNLYASLGTFEFDQHIVVTLGTEGATGTVIADAVQIVRIKDANAGDAGSSEGNAASTEGAVAATSNSLDADAQTAESARESSNLETEISSLESQVSDLTAQLKALKENAPPAPPETIVVVDHDSSQVGDYRVCIRGNPKNLGATVPRGFLTVAMAGSPQAITNGSGRLELARWIADRENPLTARVAVNRIWHHLFGSGLVRTVDNFGLVGEAPSHPELLDHLATRLIDLNWSTKSLIREILASRAYRLSSEPTGPAQDADPENLLLTHQRQRRLDAEAIYDSILVLSGRLDPTVGGDTLRPETKSEYGYEFDVGRRAVYFPVFRNRLPDVFAVFDFPDPNLSVGRRSVSTLSTQALFFMNSPFVVEQARFMAERHLNLPQVDDSTRLLRLYEGAYGRPPTDEELRLAVRFLEESWAEGEEGRRCAWTGLCQALLASLDFRYLD